MEEITTKEVHIHLFQEPTTIPTHQVDFIPVLQQLYMLY